MANERTGGAEGGDGNATLDIEGHTFERVDGAPRVVDPATGSTPGGDAAGSGPRRRGRRPGSRNSVTGKKSPLDVNGLETLLFSLHAMAAAYLRIPELELEKTEAERLSAAAARVLAHYPVTLAAESIDIVNLVMACGMIYGSRVMAIRVRKSRAGAPHANAADPREPVKVFQFVPPGAEAR